MPPTYEDVFLSRNSPDLFSDVLADLLAPLAQALVAQGMTLASATEALKQALCNAAIAAEGEGVSDSRISILTGLHRKDVRRLRSHEPVVPGRKTANRMALLIGHWATDPDFQGQDGRPRALPRESADEKPAFNDLVRRLRLDMAPGSMLQALIDQGAVFQDEDGLLHLASDALVPEVGAQELVAAYHATLATHMAAATQNLLAQKGARRQFDRVLRYSHLSDASVAELDQLARDEAQSFLTRLNARAHELQQRDAEHGARGRFAAGAYILPTPDAAEKDAE